LRSVISYLVLVLACKIATVLATISLALRTLLC